MKPIKYYVEQEWRNTANAIVKYKPFFYDEKGIYTKKEWISRYDVGLEFDNHVFTIEEYMLVEQKYVNAVLKVMELEKCKYLTIAHIGDTLLSSKNSLKEMLIGQFSEYDKDLCDFYININEGQRLGVQQVAKLIRLNLRELTNTDIVNENHHLEFHFGYDYYMYCNTRLPKEILKLEIEKIGLYLNPRE